MAKKTTKTDASVSGADKDSARAKPAKRAVAKLAGSVKKTIKAVLEPKVPAAPKHVPPAQPTAPAPADPILTTSRKSRTPGSGTSQKSRTPGAGKRAPHDGNGKSATARFTNDDIALRAYFIAKHRNETGQPGSPEQDWIEAERQLAAETARGLVHS